MLGNNRVSSGEKQVAKAYLENMTMIRQQGVFPENAGSGNIEEITNMFCNQNICIFVQIKLFKSH